MMTLDNVIQIL